MSLCWKIYHFFHHKFSKNTNKPPQMHRPVIRIDIQKKKKIAKKCLFWPPRGCEKMVIFHTLHLQKKIILISSLFFLEVWCVKNYHFFTAPRWSEKALFCTIFFFSEYPFWSQVGASGVVYLSFLRIYGGKNDKFSSTMTY